MAVRFKKPDGKEFVTDFCDSNLNLLAHAQAVECDLGSECGGHGVCGQDRIRISRADGAPAALSAHTDEEMRHLSERDRRAGWRLACQVFPETGDSDLVVEVLSGRNASP